MCGPARRGGLHAGSPDTMSATDELPCVEQRRLAGAASADARLAAQEAHAQAHAPALQPGTGTV